MVENSYTPVVRLHTHNAQNGSDGGRGGGLHLVQSH